MRIERAEPHDGLPQEDRFSTIGQFYEAIEVGPQHLATEHGEAALFCGEPARR